MMHALLVAVLLASPAVVDDEVVAQVNGHAITAAEVTARAAQTAGRPAPAALLEDLINEEVLGDDAVRAGLDREPEVVAAARDATRRAAARLLIERELGHARALSDDELLEMYHGAADSARLAQIVVGTQDEAAKVLEHLRAGARFADEAKASLDGKNGEPVTLVRGQLDPALAEVAFHAPLDVATGPVALRLGFAVVVIKSREIGDAADFAAKKAEIARYAGEQMRVQLKGHLVEQLRKRAAVTVDEAFLGTTGTRLDATPEEAEHVVAAVAGAPIRYRAVLERVQRLAGGRQGGHFSGPTVKTELAWGLVDEQLLADTAVARGLDAEPEARDAGARAARDAVVRLAAARLRKTVPAPGADEIQTYYRQHLAELVRPARRVCRHILVAGEAQARELAARLAAGGDWDAAARDYSLDTATAAAGGVIGTLDDRQLDRVAKAGEPALAAAFSSAKVGAVVGPVKSRAGWHVVSILQPEPPTYERLPDIQDRLAARILAERQDQAVRARLGGLRAGAKVDINRAALERLEKQP